MKRHHRLFAAAIVCTIAVPGLAATTPANNAAPASNVVPASDSAPAAKDAPQTRLCIDNSTIRAKDLSPRNGYFVRTSQGWWRNTGPACAAFARDRALRTRSTQNAQCRGDVVTVFDPFSRIEYGGCVLGGWERVSAPPKD